MWRGNQSGLSARADQRKEVFALIRDAGPEGMTMKEVAKVMGVQLNRVSGRGSDLKRLEMVEENGVVRDGCAVLVVKGTSSVDRSLRNLGIRVFLKNSSMVSRLFAIRDATNDRSVLRRLS